ncbi:MAG: LLM class flavin-dependent oxidoreductase [Acidimicrobiia bacterium]|nr:LLM class flavin-dependent oxidoreductase [Acidimicrobiia bacterium]MDH3462098.1 LLM class flavin-dependent oxidoreductase [Acidimicrobiia bacterium]
MERMPRFGLMASGQMPDETPDPGVFRTIAETAEGLGYDSLWVGDHLSFGNPILEGTVAAAAFAGYTRGITLGTGVLLIPLRNAGLVAKQMASLDYLTGGRLICGIGVGGDSPKDFELVGIDPRQRGARADEGIEVMKGLWSAPTASFHGRFHDFEDVGISPLPTQPGGPPVWVGGKAEGALRRAGVLADGWIAYMVSPERYATNLQIIRDHASGADREPSAITPAMMIPTRIGATTPQAEEELRIHLTNRYHREFTTELIRKVCLAGTPEHIAARVGEYVEAGVEHLVFLSGGAPSDSISQFEMLYKEVVVSFGANQSSRSPA